jgi:hypothetical protein
MHPNASNAAALSGNNIVGLKRKASEHGNVMRNLRATVVAECEQVQVVNQPLDSHFYLDYVESVSVSFFSDEMSSRWYYPWQN